ncbi:glycosyltransferase family 2 protein [Cellulomonas timonensis]|uniref:glycosyltransferase family 2 protein n=1 Tax=Cellulomonas timonensis TaxID=1689271 RepID=UPI000A529F87|nr:glycosyltransferase family 2 protein [Cellulomonas timonensis]
MSGLIDPSAPAGTRPHSSGDRGAPVPEIPPNSLAQIFELDGLTDTTAPAPSAGRRLYVPVATKFLFAVLGTVLWVGLSVWISQAWINELTDVVGVLFAWVVVGLVAYLPGAVVAFMTFSLAMDRQPPLRVAEPITPLTVIIAARNEEQGIGPTIAAVHRTDYAGPVHVILADNGSTDGTAEAARRTADELGVSLSVVREERPGKANALNTALETVATEYVVTVDADTLLHVESLRRLVSRLESAPDDTVAVAGAVLVRNSRENLLARMQEWDYYLGIAAVKRMQGLYQATLVAQGAFSIYLTADLRRIGGWPDAIGEDIVVTWRLMEHGQRVYFEPTAVAFTDVPTKVRHFMRQRARWARGMFEGLAAVPPWRQRRPMTRFVAGIDLLIPGLDIGYALIWMPGIVLFLLGYPWVVSAWTLVVLPLTVLVYGSLRRYQSRNVFGPLNLRVRRNRGGYLAFLLLYQALCSWASLAGYAQHLFGARRRWK